MSSLLGDWPGLAAMVGTAAAAGLSYLSARKTARTAPAVQQAAENSTAAIGRLEGRVSELTASVHEIARDMSAGLRELTGSQARLEGRIERVEARASEEPTRPDMPRPRPRMGSRPR